MKERPILFSSEMVRAILAARKTQTRRVVKPQPEQSTSTLDGVSDRFQWKRVIDTYRPLWPSVISRFCPYGQPGDRLWVREMCRPCAVPQCSDTAICVEYRASDYCKLGHLATLSRKGWRPSIFMPRWASRITLEIVGVRCERVNEISEADAHAEGADQEFRTVVYSPAGVKDYHMPVSFRGGFANLWDEINAKRGYSWDSNPWVWVVEFKRI